MRLIVASIDAGAADAMLGRMHARGLPAVVVWSEAGPLSGGSATLLVGVHDRDTPEVIAAIASRAAVTDAPARSLLPLTDPTDLHVGRPVAAAAGASALFVLRVSRFEQIW